MELTLRAEQQGLAEVGDNIRGALWVIGDNAGHIKQGIAKLKGESLARFDFYASAFDHSGWATIGPFSARSVILAC